jgi:hypothetical protein
MKDAVKEKSQKSFLNGFLSGNRMVVTPAEMKIMESLGVISTT